MHIHQKLKIIGIKKQNTNLTLSLSRDLMLFLVSLSRQEAYKNHFCTAFSSDWFSRNFSFPWLDERWSRLTTEEERRTCRRSRSSLKRRQASNQNEWHRRQRRSFSCTFYSKVRLRDHVLRGTTCERQIFSSSWFPSKLLWRSTGASVSELLFPSTSCSWRE